MIISYIVVLLAGIHPGRSRVLDKVKIIWPKLYHFKGEIIDLSVGIVEPFEIWYNKESNKSRLDYYGGMVKGFYFGETKENSGREFQIYPVTMKDEETRVLCIRRQLIKPPLNFLFDVSNFTYGETIMYEGKSIQVWKNVQIVLDSEKLIEELYVYRNDENVDILLRHEKRMYNLWTGALQKHSITTYFDYKPPSDDDLNIELGKVLK